MRQRKVVVHDLTRLRVGRCCQWHLLWWIAQIPTLNVWHRLAVEALNEKLLLTGGPRFTIVGKPIREQRLTQILIL